MDDSENKGPAACKRIIRNWTYTGTVLGRHYSLICFHRRNYFSQEEDTLQKLMKLAENIVVYMAERSVGKSSPFFQHKVEKPEHLEELVKRCKENKGQD